MNGKILASRAAEGDDDERKHESPRRHGGRESWTNWEREESEGNRTKETNCICKIYSLRFAGISTMQLSASACLFCLYLYFVNSTYLYSYSILAFHLN